MFLDVLIRVWNIISITLRVSIEQLFNLSKNMKLNIFLINTSDLKSLILKFIFACKEKENITSVIKNVLKTGHTRKSENDLSFDFTISNLTTESETNIFEKTLRDSKMNEFFGWVRYTLIMKFNKKIQFRLEKRDFINIIWFEIKKINVYLENSYLFNN